MTSGTWQHLLHSVTLNGKSWKMEPSSVASIVGTQAFAKKTKNKAMWRLSSPHWTLKLTRHHRRGAFSMKAFLAPSPSRTMSCSSLGRSKARKPYSYPTSSLSLHIQRNGACDNVWKSLLSKICSLFQWQAVTFREATIFKHFNLEEELPTPENQVRVPNCQWTRPFSAYLIKQDLWSVVANKGTKDGVV